MLQKINEYKTNLMQTPYRCGIWCAKRASYVPTLYNLLTYFEYFNQSLHY